MKVVIWNSRGRIVGDTIRETSILKSIEGKIDIIGSSIIKDCYSGNPYVNKLIVDKRLDILTKNVSIFRKIEAYTCSVLYSLNKIKRYDLCIITQKNKFLFSVLSRVVGTPFLLKDDIKPNLDIAKFYFSRSELDKLDKFIKKNKKKKIGINIESRSKKRAWPIEKYIKLIQVLIDSNFEVYLIGYDTKYNSKIVSKFGNKINNLVKNKLSIRESAAILSKLNWYIGNDSGFAHVAVASGTNSLVIFLDSNAKILNRNDVIVKKLRNPSINKVIKLIK